MKATRAIDRAHDKGRIRVRQQEQADPCDHNPHQVTLCGRSRSARLPPSARSTDPGSEKPAANAAAATTDRPNSLGSWPSAGKASCEASSSSSSAGSEISLANFNLAITATEPPANWRSPGDEPGRAGRTAPDSQCSL